MVASRLPTDNAGLVHFLGLRARGEPAQGTLDQLIETLAGSTPEARFQACADLVAIGTPALPRCATVGTRRAASPLTWPSSLPRLPSNPMGGLLDLRTVVRFAARTPRYR